jgi:hypothetical protein
LSRIGPQLDAFAISKFTGRTEMDLYFIETRTPGEAVTPDMREKILSFASNCRAGPCPWLDWVKVFRFVYEHLEIDGWALREG